MTGFQTDDTDPQRGATAELETTQPNSRPPVFGNGPLEPSTLILQRFVIERLAGIGGMGAVYRALDTETNQPVAVKAIYSEHPTRTARFLREVSVLSKVRHPAVVRYLEHGKTDDQLLILVMEWLEGEDLAARLRRQPLSIGDSVRLLRRIAEGVAAAHSVGVIHRDIKPSNIYLVNGDLDAAKVVDFGIARDRKEDVVTQTGTVVGTVGYMAPEQARGETNLSPSVDVFSLGCLLYECLTGHPAFSGPTAPSMLVKVLIEDAPLVSLYDARLTPLDDFVAAMMSKDPKRRPADAQAVLRELRVLDSNSSAWNEARWLAPMTDQEQRFRSFVVCSASCKWVAPSPSEPATEASEETNAAEREIATTTRSFGGKPVLLAKGTFLIGLPDEDAPIDSAIRAAACALALHRRHPDYCICVATVRAENERAACQRIVTELNGRAQEHRRIALNDLAARLLEGRFETQLSDGVTSLVGDLDVPLERRFVLGRVAPCVGRDRELSFLETTLEECIDEPDLRCVFLMGPPGIGKTRLVNEWGKRALVSSRAKVVIASCDPSLGSPLTLARKLVRRAAGIRDDYPIEEQRRVFRDYTQRLFEGDPTADFLHELLFPEHALASVRLDAARRDPAAMRKQVHIALIDWARREAASQPLVLVVDDLHWCDPQSLAYLEEVFRTTSQTPLMLLALSRPEIQDNFPSARLAWLSNNELRLGGLTRGAAEKLIVATVGDLANRELRERIVRLANGNAFYLEELVRWVADGKGELPETVLAVAQTRLERLPATMRKILRAASVFGYACWVDGVAAVAQNVCEVEDWLDRLVDEEILISSSDSLYPGHRQFEFRHALLRDAAYQTLTERDRILGHRAAGAWLESIGSREAKLLAEHFAIGESRDKALKWILFGSDAALLMGDTETAIALATQGLEMGASGEERGRLLLNRGYAGAWRLEYYAGAFRECLELLPRDSAPWWLALSLAFYEAAQARDPVEWSQYLPELLDAPPKAEITGTRGLGLFALIGGFAHMGKSDLAAALLEKIERITALKTGDDPIAEAWVKVAKSYQYVLSSPGSWPIGKALELCDEALVAFKETGSTSGEEAVYRILASALRAVGDYEGAADAALKVQEIAQVTGSKLSEHWGLLLEAMARLQSGNPERASELSRGLVGSPDRAVCVMARALEAISRFRGGDIAGGMSSARAVYDSPQPGRFVGGTLLAGLALRAGNAEQAVEFIRAAEAGGSPMSAESELEFLSVKWQCNRQIGALGCADEALQRARTIIQRVSETLEPGPRERFIATPSAARFFTDE